jgi:hypothetical protein
VRIADIVAEVTDTKFLGKQSRKHEYFGWAKAVVEQVRGANPRLATKFDAVWEAGRGTGRKLRPVGLEPIDFSKHAVVSRRPGNAQL